MGTFSLLQWTTLCLVTAIAFLSLHGTGGLQMSVLEEGRAWRSMTIPEYIASVNKPAVTTIQSNDGGVIRCVKVDEKALKIPSEIRMNPSFSEEEDTVTHEPDPGTVAEKEDTVTHEPDPGTVASNVTWQQSVTCPAGTIPTREIKASDVEAFGSVANYLHKHGRSRAAKPRDCSGPAHEYAEVQYLDSGITGVGATFNVWAPAVSPHEFSLAQLWLVAIGKGANDVQTMEVGWQVYPDRLKDNKSHLFIYWTADYYEATGCYDLDCPGFVQVARESRIGEPLPDSTTDGHQVELHLQIRKEKWDGYRNWWLRVQNHVIGYWPESLFGQGPLSNSSNVLQWGGEIVNFATNGVHTSTDMGSGAMARAGFRRAAYIRKLYFVDSDHQVQRYPDPLQVDETPGCYTVTRSTLTNQDRVRSSSWGRSFYFGGPGYSDTCRGVPSEDNSCS